MEIYKLNFNIVKTHDFKTDFIKDDENYNIFRLGDIEHISEELFKFQGIIYITHRDDEKYIKRLKNIDIPYIVILMNKTIPKYYKDYEFIEKSEIDESRNYGIFEMPFSDNKNIIDKFIKYVLFIFHKFIIYPQIKYFREPNIPFMKSYKLVKYLDDIYYLDEIIEDKETIYYLYDTHYKNVYYTKNKHLFQIKPQLINFSEYIYIFNKIYHLFILFILNI